jgi:hypothetical protein
MVGGRVSVGLVSASLACLLWTASASAAVTYYTLPGAGATTCAQGDECSLTHALSLPLAPGDSIVMEPGTSAYTPGSINIPAGITIGGQAGAAMPTIQGPGTGTAVIMSAPGATLHDVRVQAGAAQGALFMASIPGGSTAERVAAIAPTGSACQLGAATLRDTLCWGASGDGVIQNLTSGTHTATLTNVTAIGSGNGIDAITSGGDNRTVVGTNVIAKGGFRDVSTGESGGSTTTVTLANSNYAVADHSAGGTITPAGTNGNQTAAPLLSADFHELAGSPTIDAGLAAPDIGTLDLDRNPRISPTCRGGTAGAPDIGAFEFPTATPPAAACSVFTIGKLKLNKKKGTADLTLTVPGSGSLNASGKGLKSTTANATIAGEIKIKLKASGKSKHKLAGKGKLKLKVKLAWTPTGGAATTQTDKVKLKKK